MLKKEKIRYEVLHPTYKALYDLVGEDNMMKVYHEFRGTQVQMPMKLYDRQTLEKYLGSISDKTISIKDLSHIYGFSQRWIRKALFKGKK